MLDLGLKGKIAIVTGGSDGLGRATALRLASEGCKVAICARRADHLEAAAAAIAAETSAEVLPCRADVSAAADIDALVSAAVDRFGGHGARRQNFVLGHMESLSVGHEAC